MKSKIFFALFALLMSAATLADAQPRGRHNNGNNRNGYHNNNGGYNRGPANCDNNRYQGRGGYGDGNCNNGYGRGRRVYRRPVPVSYCQPVVYARPRYYAPRPVIVGRPRVNINIGF